MPGPGRAPALFAARRRRLVDGVAAGRDRHLAACGGEGRGEPHASQRHQDPLAAARRRAGAQPGDPARAGCHSRRELAVQPCRRRANAARDGDAEAARRVSDLPPPFDPAPDAAPVSAPVPPPVPTRPVYDGTLGELYGIYFRHLLLMLLTLGWSRFWGRTRLRRYLWSHFSLLGDRFEYRGRGLELLVGFLMVLVMLGAWAGAVWTVWRFALHQQTVPGLGVIDIIFLSIALIGLPLSFVGQYSGLRYKLSRTRWRGIRCAMEGSAWTYGGLATFLTFVNAITGRLLTPVVSVNLARPRIQCPCRHAWFRVRRPRRRYLRALSRLLLPEHPGLACDAHHRLRSP